MMAICPRNILLISALTFSVKIVTLGRVWAAIDSHSKTCLYNGNVMDISKECKIHVVAFLAMVSHLYGVYL